MRYSSRLIACICFVLSGAASVSYQTIWLREAMTYFGVITPVISSVLSVFMLGLAIGTLGFGAIARKLTARQALLGYILVEIAIALLANLVPFAFRYGYDSLLGVESQTSDAYLFASWAVITLTLIPVCTLIGATLPLIMRFLEAQASDGRNFGSLYFANLVGALIGCFAPLVLIELAGFHLALEITAAENLCVAALAFCFLWRMQPPAITPETAAAPAPVVTGSISWADRAVLFLTGFVALGSEVVWIRAFTPAVSTTVYAFAAILAVYLASNFFGTWRYLQGARKHCADRRFELAVWLMPALALLPIIGSSEPLLISVKWVTLISIIGVCVCFGLITPYIIDRSCRNHPGLTARAYGYNFAGCILGPLFTTYLLFPIAGLKGSLILYALLLLPVVFLLMPASRIRMKSAAAFAGVFIVAWFSPSFEDHIREEGKLARDHVGYIGATGEGMKKLLTVNGIGMTYLTTITKNMTHLPLAHHSKPRSALVICFGMGTTVRSLTRWPELERIHAVELSEGVTHMMPYFHADADSVLHDPRVRITVDDGRRYLMRTDEHYDIITIDPPPPIRAAGSGLLYSDEFIAVTESRLNEGGILAHWLPAGDDLLTHAVITAIKRHFAHVVILDSIEEWGLHILASDQPIPTLDSEAYIAALPESARSDILEWHPEDTMESLAAKSLRRFGFAEKTLPNKQDVYMSDDRLYNEFFRLRREGLYTP